MNDLEIDKLKDHYSKCMKLAEEWGLQPFPTDFHVVPADKMYEIASYGIPGHFSHWTYGRDYWRQKTMYDYGYSKIYELVVNANPAQAFLLETNSLLENMFVVAHVTGHSDFFANNVYFDHTNRSMIHSVSSVADRVYQYEIQHGRYIVEEFIDDILTIKEHVEPHLHTKKKDKDYNTIYQDHPYEDLIPEEQEMRWLHELTEENNKKFRFPFEPERDIVQFIADHGRLQEWQRDLMGAMHDEMMYFLPQAQTKVMNEGWASIIHQKMMHEIDPACDPGGIEFATLHAGVLSHNPGSLNPYWLGFNIFKRIIDLHGWDAALEARELDNDETFIRNHLDEKICRDLDLFAYAFNDPEKQWEVTDTSWEDVRDALVQTKVNMGRPYIVVRDGDYRRQGILYLKHESDGRELLPKYTTETLKSIERLWGNPVYLDTVVEGKTVTYKCEHGQVSSG